MTIEICEERLQISGDTTIDVEPEQVITADRTRRGVIRVLYWTETEYVCGYVKDDGEECQITVSNEDARCHHHENE